MKNMGYKQKLKELREDRDKSQKEIAEILKTDQSYYAKYENGRHPLPLNHLITLCEYYQVSADYILGLPEGLNWPRNKKKGGTTKQTTDSAKSIFLFSLRTSWALRAMDVLLSLQTTFFESLTENRYRDKIGVPLTAVLLFL